MKGVVDNGGRSLLEVLIRKTRTSDSVLVKVWVDTGFTGDLVLPKRLVDEFDLQRSGSVDGVLADGSEIELSTYTCAIEWFGFVRKLEVMANEGEYPLLGVGMLLGLALCIDYRNLKLSLTPTAYEGA